MSDSAGRHGCARCRTWGSRYRAIATLAVSFAAGCERKTEITLATVPGAIAVGMFGATVVARREQRQAMAEDVAVALTRE